MIKWDRSKGRPEPIQALNRIREAENGEPLVSLKEFCPSVRIARPQVIPYLRQQPAEMLETAARKLPPGFFLSVIDAWRPFDRQRRIYEYMTACAQEVWPEASYPQLRRRVNRFVAPIDQKAPPGHCTGAAVDVWLVDDQDEMCDVWSPFSRFKAAPTYAFGLTDEAHRNRMVLVETMLSVGFSNCRDEWWHYSFGDAGWAVRLGFSDCFYGIAQLPADEYEEQEKLWIEAMKERTNPFKEMVKAKATRVRAET